MQKPVGMQAARSGFCAGIEQFEVTLLLGPISDPPTDDSGHVLHSQSDPFALVEWTLLIGNVAFSYGAIYY
jgi:hypothetical protein